MLSSRRIPLVLLCAALAAAACGDAGYDPPEQAEPFDTIAPAPNAETPAPGEPGE